MSSHDEAIEAAVEAVKDSEGWNAEDDGLSRQTAEAAISAYLTAIAGEVEPVAWFLPWNEWHGWQSVATCHYGEVDLVPLYSAASLAALQAKLDAMTNGRDQLHDQLEEQVLFHRRTATRADTAEAALTAANERIERLVEGMKAACAKLSYAANSGQHNSGITETVSDLRTLIEGK